MIKLRHNGIFATKDFWHWQVNHASKVSRPKTCTKVSLSLCTALAGLCPPFGRAGDDSAVFD